MSRDQSRKQKSKDLPEKRKKSDSKKSAPQSEIPPLSKGQQLFLKAKELAAKDDRFSAIASNPIYRSVPRAEKKVDIDSRFKSMFNDDKFKLKYKVDKRGRPVDTTTDENLKKYYNLVEDDEDERSSESDEDDNDNSTSNDNDDCNLSNESESDLDSDEIEGDVEESSIKIKTKNNLPEAIKKKLRSSNFDYARGEGDFVSEESSDEDTSQSEDEEEVNHEWGELDRDASRTEESTKRMALCNMDWDRLKAVDLMVLFNSFLPSGGVLVSVSIFVSEFGKKRIEEEEVRGPIELAQFKQEVTSDNEDENINSDEEDEGSAFHREKLRQYQLNRLKYFYAVLEFDSVSTAEKVYEECDGMEYESSAAKIDLRFIPDDMTFDEVPKDKCQNVPDSSKYRPKFFTTTALQQVKVDCTWDETDPTRKEIIGKVLDTKSKIDDDDLKAYLASSSEEEDNDVEPLEEEDNFVKKGKEKDNLDPIARYRALLESIESTEKKKKNDDVQLEITWGVGLKQKAEQLVKKKTVEKETEKLTPWEAQLSKQKEKKKLRKLEKKNEPEKNSESDDSDSSDEKDIDIPFSDDDVDIDFNDPFFKEELESRKKSLKVQKVKQGDTHKNRKNSEHEPDTKANGELDLLLMDEDDGKKHFNFKQLIEDENISKSKRKRKFKKAKKNPTELANKVDGIDDNFQVDVEDDRFSALYSSHLYNIDPSEPNFKKTKGMEKIIQKKQSVRSYNEDKPVNKQAKITTDSNDLSSSNSKPSGKSRDSAELSSLVKSVKKNIQNVQMTENNNKKAKSRRFKNKF